jgi:predicted acetyltransferase
VIDRVRLRPLREEDESAVLAAHAALNDYGFLLWRSEQPLWSKYLQMLRDYQRGENLPTGRVTSTFLVAVVDGDIVGRTSIRHELNEFLATIGGHIGYAVLPFFRRRGYATEILRQSLVIARSVGVDRVLITCDEDNVASMRVIERCGGVFSDLADQGPGQPRKRRYWID